MGAGAIGVEVCLTSRWDSKGRTLPISDHIFLGSSTVLWLSSWDTVWWRPASDKHRTKPLI